MPRRNVHVSMWQVWYRHGQCTLPFIPIYVFLGAIHASVKGELDLNIPRIT